MEEIRSQNILSVNKTVVRSKLEGIPVTESSLRRWLKNGTLRATYTGRKALIFWPDVVKLLCGESV